MVNLIISLVGIALVAITALVALFTLGDSFTDNSGKADYSRLQNEANQIVVASEYYMALNSGKSPDNINQLVEENYLENKFSGLVDKATVNGEDISVEWEYGFDDYITQYMDTDERCANINKAAGGSGKVEDIPSCSSEFDLKNPCCTF